MSAKWNRHGDTSSPGIHGVFAPGHIHFVIPAGPQDRASALVLDLVATAAAGRTGCGITRDGGGNRRNSLAAWFAVPVAAPVAAAIVVGPDRSQTIEREIEAAALNRGVQQALPIVHAAARRSVVESIASAEIRQHEAEKTLGRRPGLIAFDNMIFGPGGARSPAGGALMQVRDANTHAAILVVADEAPAALLTEASVVIEVGTSAFGCGRSGIGTWGFEFDMLSVRFPDGFDARVIRPGDAIEVAPECIDANLATIPVPPPKPVVLEPEPVKRVAILPNGRSFSAAELAPWADYDLVTHDAVRAV